MTRRVRFSPFVAAGVFAGLLALASPRRAMATDVPFVPQTPVTSSVLFTLDVSTADVDGDGDLDVLAASYAGDKVTWHENLLGDGSSWAIHTILTGFNGASFVSAADIDGDGDTDLFASAFIADTVVWFENEAGNGSVWSITTVAPLANAAETVVAADVDRDGDVDAMTASRGDDTVAWYENAAGDGSVWTRHNIYTLADGVESTFAADVDGDGDLDSLSASFNDSTVAWHENLAGNGSTWARHVIFTPVSAADFVVAADLDGDGDQDALSSAFGSGSIHWHRNVNGDGSAWATFTITTAAVRPEAVWTADLDKDGDLDALVASGVGDKITWHENVNGDGSAWTTRTIATAVNNVYSVYAADLDGDGDDDVIGGAYTSVPWYRNETIHSSACFLPGQPLSTAANGAVGAFAGDVDGDGDTDAASASLLDGKVAWYDNTAGNGSAWTTRTVTTAAPGAYSVAGTDVDGDGDTDLLSASAGDGKVAWYDNTAGDGSAWTTRTITTDAPSATGVFAADVDGDGDADALSSSFDDDKVAWYENVAGNGTVWTTRTITTAADGAHAVFAADVDGDGDVDALSSSFYDNTVAWYENVAGNGSAWTRHAITKEALGTVSVFAIDLDRDGDTDVLAAWNAGNTVAWYENTAGNGSAWTPHFVSTEAGDTDSVFAADMDGDGDVDTLVASFLASTVTWYENTAGDGSAWVPRTLSTSASGANEVLASDVDGDGDADVLSASALDDTIAWYDDRGGQVSLTAADTAPPTAGNGELAAMLRIEAAHLGRPGDHDAELASLGLLFEEEPADPLTTAEANALIESLRLYRDANGNGVFDPGDTLVVSVPDLSLTAGIQTVALPDGDPNVLLALAAPRVYFVVVELTADASQQAPHQFRVTHLALGPSASFAEDRAFDIRLRLACPADVSSSIKQVVPVELMGFSVE